jgi:hypothetical protein
VVHLSGVKLAAFVAVREAESGPKRTLREGGESAPVTVTDRI